jgi:hypothetical protein
MEIMKMAEYQGSVVAKFADLDAANKALRNLRDAQQSKGLEIREGAVVIGTADGVMSVADIDDIGLGEVTSNALDLMAFLGIGTVKIAAETAISGGALLLSSARRAAVLSGSLFLMPARMLFSVFETENAIEYLGTAIEPGVCAVVAVLDEPDDTAQVIAELSESGGEVIEIDVDTDVDTDIETEE